MGQRRKTLWLLRALVLFAAAASAYFLSWWGATGRLSPPWLPLALAPTLLYLGVQVVPTWGLYLAARKRPAAPGRPGGLSVDVFVTACGEPHGLIEAALAAACRMRGEHRTWLLDDGGDPDLERLARRLGAEYLTRTDRTNAKAGNVNAALPRTDGDVIAIFDVDHVPAADFLEKTVGYFADPAVGFVQVMLTFGNGGQSWVAQAAAETSLDFYNPTSIGMDALGSVTMMGSNSLVRRSALLAIGGYQPGLAEDLATSVALHAAGWRSAYVAEPLAPGLAPATIAAWFTQQMKWARGVFELLVTVFPRVFPRLTWGQRLCYTVRMTKYWIGPVAFLHLAVTLGVVFGGGAALQIGFLSYLLHLLPVAVLDVLIRSAALSAWRGSAVPSASLWRAVALVYFTWPIYTAAWLMALLRLPLAFRHTPKGPAGDLKLSWIFPQAVAALLLFAGAARDLPGGNGSGIGLLTAFTALQGGLQVLVLCQRLRPERLKGLRGGRVASGERE